MGRQLWTSRADKSRNFPVDLLDKSEGFPILSSSYLFTFKKGKQVGGVRWVYGTKGHVFGTLDHKSG